MTIRVLIVDDDALVRAGLRMMIETQDDLEVVGEKPETASRPSSSPTSCNPTSC